MKYCLSACFRNPKTYVLLAGVEILDICLSHISKKQSMAQEKSPGAILLMLIKYSSSVIRPKGESLNEFFKKTKHAKLFEKRTFLTPSYAHVRVRIRG